MKNNNLVAKFLQNFQKSPLIGVINRMETLRKEVNRKSIGIRSVEFFISKDLIKQDH